MLGHIKYFSFWFVIFCGFFFLIGGDHMTPFKTLGVSAVVALVVTVARLFLGLFSPQDRKNK